MAKNVQIPQELLFDLFRFFLTDEDEADREYTQEAIITALEGKLEALVRHELYTQSKTADTPQEREKARQAYLDRVGMRQSFRWSEGYQDGPPPED